MTRRRRYPSCYQQTPKGHVGVEPWTQVDQSGRRCAIVRCVELRAPRANGGQADLVKHVLNNGLSWSYYLIQKAVTERSESATPPRTQLRSPGITC